MTGALIVFGDPQRTTQGAGRSPTSVLAATTPMLAKATVLRMPWITESTTIIAAAICKPRGDTVAMDMLSTTLVDEYA